MTEATGELVKPYINPSESLWNKVKWAINTRLDPKFKEKAGWILGSTEISDKNPKVDLAEEILSKWDMVVRLFTNSKNVPNENYRGVRLEPGQRATLDYGTWGKEGVENHYDFPIRFAAIKVNKATDQSDQFEMIVVSNDKNEPISFAALSREKSSKDYNNVYIIQANADNRGRLRYTVANKDTWKDEKGETGGSKREELSSLSAAKILIDGLQKASTMIPNQK